MKRVSIIQGEHNVITVPDVFLSTILGSCVAVCLHDAQARAGGMNHFLLGEPVEGSTLRPDEMQRYGVHAMEVLINAMMRVGADRSRLRAHIYGGADIVPRLGRIGTKNAEFARHFMQTERIEIGHCDLGGNKARRVEFLPWDGKVRSLLAADPPPVEAPKRVTPTNDVELF